MKNRIVFTLAAGILALQVGAAYAQQVGGQPPQDPQKQDHGQAHAPRPGGDPQKPHNPPSPPPSAPQPPPPPPPPRQQHRDSGSNAAIIGLGIVQGFAAGSNIDHNGQIPYVQYPPPPPPPPRDFRREHRHEWGPPPPWSPGWYRWCADNDDSFDPRSGTVEAWDGRRVLCVVGQQP